MIKNFAATNRNCRECFYPSKDTCPPVSVCSFSSVSALYIYSLANDLLDISIVKWWQTSPISDVKPKNILAHVWLTNQIEKEISSLCLNFYHVELNSMSKNDEGSFELKTSIHRRTLEVHFSMSLWVGRLPIQLHGYHTLIGFHQREKRIILMMP